MGDALQNFGFHRITARWFEARFGRPTTPQRDAWPLIARGLDTLVAAPTGSGKTLTAFMVAIDRLLRDALAGTLQDQTEILYISPLKALASDVRRNLEIPLAEIQACAEQEGTPVRGIRAVVRSGDTPASQRASMLKRPPHILVTTPESLYLLLTSVKGRVMLANVKTVIIDEIHALARDKRGSHLSLSLARLDDLCKKRPQRIGLSATQKPIEEIAAFLVGNEPRTPQPNGPCAIVDGGHQRDLDLAIEVPPSELATVCSQEQWQEVYERICALIAEHRSTLIFVNTRKLAERVAFHLSQQLGEEHVTSHHGSLSKELRTAAETKLKAGELKAIVATASLELGIDIGAIDLVIQIGSPRSIATFLQRVGRAGHSVGATPKGRLIALTRDELVESMALIRSVKRGHLDRIIIPEGPLDILAQQIVAEAAAQEHHEDHLFDIMRRAYPYRNLTREHYSEVIAMLSVGFAGGKQRFAYIHHDRLSGNVRTRRGARLAAITSGGAIPELGDYRVVNEADGSFIGTVNEDFAIDSSRGDIFLLGNNSWQIAGLRGTDMLVRDMHGAPPSIPFWIGEAPGRTPELSQAVSEIRDEVDSRLTLPIVPEDPLFHLESLSQLGDSVPAPYADACQWLQEATSASPWASLQVTHYMAVEKAALGVLPTQTKVVFERFFDASGGMQLVIHAPFGMRINKGWGLALRKRFCRSFDFELQASADNDGIVLSLGPQHSFPIDQLFSMLNPNNITKLLEQAILQVPLFQIRWRWNATRALAVLRRHSGQRVPPALQRFRADDLMTAVFPAQTQCQEHVTGDIELPDHPLVRQTMYDCMHEAIDLPELIKVMERITSGDIELIARDTREPSPFAYQLLNAYPYAFLDDAPLEERRARAVATRRNLAFEPFSDLSMLAPAAVEQVQREAWPDARTADELHDALSTYVVIPATRGEATPGFADLMTELVAGGRATRVLVGSTVLWSTSEAADLIQAAYPTATLSPLPELPEHLRQTWTLEDARLALIRAYMCIAGIVTSAELATTLALAEADVAATLPVVETRGDVMRGRFRPDMIAPAPSAATSSNGAVQTVPSGAVQTVPMQWVDRRLLIRIHKLTLEGLRQQIKPASAEDLQMFLLAHQHATSTTRTEGRQGLLEVVQQLAGFDAAAGAWETEILASRVVGYQASWLDELTHTGLVSWGRLKPPKRDEDSAPKGTGMTRSVPLALFPREDMGWLISDDAASRQQNLVDLATSKARHTFDAMLAGGAQFFGEIKTRTGLLETELEEALGELCWLGLIHADGFAAIRPFVSRNRKAVSRVRYGVSKQFFAGASYSLGGRWALFPGLYPEVANETRIEQWAWLLLRRYGIVFRDLLAREHAAPSWGELARTYRTLEARGLVRGGRFVAGTFGEQFALPETVPQLRAIRDRKEGCQWAVLSAADPLNLVGILTQGPRLTSSRQALIGLVDGRHVATASNGEVSFHGPVPTELEAELRHALQVSGTFRYGSPLRRGRSLGQAAATPKTSDLHLANAVVAPV